jgi:hypothetical protein
MIPLAGIFTAIFWGIVVALLVVIAAIARFYEVTSGQPSHYRWFAVPVGLLGAGAVRYAWLGDFLGDATGDAFLLGGSAALVALTAWLLRLMMGGRR